MQRTPRTSRTVAENKSRDTILKDEKNTIYDRLKTWINCIHVFSSAHFLKADLYITAFIFPFFVPVFLLSGATTLEWSPSRAFRRAASCFGVPEIISGAPKHNLPCSLEHEFFCRKIKIWRSIHFPPIKSFRRHPYHFLNTPNRSHRGTWAV